MREKLNNKIEYYLDYCENVRRMTPTTIRTKRTVLFRFSTIIGNKRFSEITNKDINYYIKSFEGQATRNNAINGYLQIIISFFKFYQKLGEKTSLMIPLIPTLKGEPHRHSCYSKEAIYEVIENADDFSAMIIRIGFDTGMRLSELTNLKLSDFSGRKIHYMGKGREWHDTWIREETYQKLLQFIKDYKVENYLWYEANPNKHFHINSIAKYMRDAFKACGYDDFHPHSLRHSFATNLQKRGASVEEIQHMIGHKNLATTERYLHSFDNDKMRELFDKYA